MIFNCVPKPLGVMCRLYMSRFLNRTLRADSNIRAVFVLVDVGRVFTLALLFSMETPVDSRWFLKKKKRKKRKLN